MAQWNGVMEWWSDGAMFAPASQRSDTPLLHFLCRRTVLYERSQSQCLTAELADAEFRRQQLMQQRLVASSQFRPATDGQPPFFFQQRKLFPLFRPRPKVLTRHHH